MPRRDGLRKSPLCTTMRRSFPRWRRTCLRKSRIVAITRGNPGIRSAALSSNTWMFSRVRRGFCSSRQTSLIPASGLTRKKVVASARVETQFGDLAVFLVEGDEKVFVTEGVVAVILERISRPAHSGIVEKAQFV